MCVIADETEHHTTCMQELPRTDCSELRHDISVGSCAGANALKPGESSSESAVSAVRAEITAGSTGSRSWRPRSVKVSSLHERTHNVSSTGCTTAAQPAVRGRLMSESDVNLLCLLEAHTGDDLHIFRSNSAASPY